MRDLALALIISRVVAPASKLATLTAWDDVTLGADLAVAGASTDEVYAAMDYLLDRQDGIEKSFAARYLAPKVNPSRMALYDLSSSWMTGTKCPLAKRGYSRDGKKGLPQIEYALLTEPGRLPGRGPGVRREHRRPDRVHRRGHRGEGHLRVGEHGDGRGPRDDHPPPASPR